MCTLHASDIVCPSTLIITIITVTYINVYHILYIVLHSYICRQRTPCILLHAMEVCFLTSGETLTVLDVELQGQTVKAAKKALAAKVGISRFKQRFLLKMVRMRSRMMKF